MYMYLKKMSIMELTALSKMGEVLETLKNLSDEEKDFLVHLFQDTNKVLKEKEDWQREHEKKFKDWQKQKETQNFRFFCGACRNGILPRCSSLHEQKYCNGLFDCDSRCENPEYTKES